jgi:hypothetical protein
MPTIYQISDDMAALDALLAETGGEITPEAEAAFNQFEAELAANLHNKTDAYCALLAEIDARAAARKAEAKRLADRAKADERTADALRERLRFVWEQRKLGKVETDRFTVSLAKNGGKQPLDIRCGVEDLPSWAVKSETIVTADKEAIRSRLDAGESLDFASLMERGTRISIR